MVWLMFQFLFSFNERESSLCTTSLDEQNNLIVFKSHGSAEDTGRAFLTEILCYEKDLGHQIKGELPFYNPLFKAWPLSLTLLQKIKDLDARGLPTPNLVRKEGIIQGIRNLREGALPTSRQCPGWGQSIFWMVG